MLWIFFFFFPQEKSEIGIVLGIYQRLNFGSEGKESACNVGDVVSVPGLGKTRWRREWLPTPVFFLGELHGWRILAGYGPWGHTELEMTE